MSISLGAPYRPRDGRLFYKPINGGPLAVVADVHDDYWFGLNRLGEIEVRTVREDRRRRPEHVKPDAKLDLVERGSLHTLLTLVLAPDRIHTSSTQRAEQLKQYAAHANAALAFALEWPEDPTARVEHTEQMVDAAVQLGSSQTARRLEIAASFARAADFRTTTGRGDDTKDNPRAVSLILRMIMRLAKEQYGIDRGAIRKNATRRLPASLATALAAEDDVEQILAITMQPLTERRKRRLRELTSTAGRLAPYHFASNYINWATAGGRIVWFDGMPADQHQLIRQAFVAERQLLIVAAWLSAIKRTPNLMTATLLEQILAELPLGNDFDTPQQELAKRIEPVVRELHAVCASPTRFQRDVTALCDRGKKIMRERIFYHDSAARHHIQYPLAEAWIPQRYRKLLKDNVPTRAVPRQRKDRRTGYRLPGMANI